MTLTLALAGDTMLGRGVGEALLRDAVLRNDLSLCVAARKRGHGRAGGERLDQTV